MYKSFVGGWVVRTETYTSGVGSYMDSSISVWRFNDMQEAWNKASEEMQEAIEEIELGWHSRITISHFNDFDCCKESITLFDNVTTDDTARFLALSFDYAVEGSF